MEIVPGIRLVGGGWLGFGLSNHFDGNVYLIASAGDAVLVDAGCGLATAEIAANVAAAGVPPASISRILLTHAHADHAAGAGELRSLLGAEIWAAPFVADIVERGDEEQAGLAAARQAGVYPDGVRLVPTPVARRLDAAPFAVGSLTVEPLPTPGHAGGHLSFLVQVGGRTMALCGDLVFARGRVVLLDTPDSDADALRSSIGALADRSPDVLLPGHGELVLRGARDHLRAALDRFDAGVLPEPFAV